MEKVKYMSLLKLNYTVVILVNGEIFFEIFKVLALQFFFFGLMFYRVLLCQCLTLTDSPFYKALVSQGSDIRF